MDQCPLLPAKENVVCQLIRLKLFSIETVSINNVTYKPFQKKQKKNILSHSKFKTENIGKQNKINTASPREKYSTLIYSNLQQKNVKCRNCYLFLKKLNERKYCEFHVSMNRKMYF